MNSAQKRAQKKYAAKLHRYQLQFAPQDEAIYRHFRAVTGSKNEYVKRLIREDMDHRILEKKYSDIINTNTKKAIRRVYESGWCGEYEDARGAVYDIDTYGNVTLIGYRRGKILDELLPEDRKCFGTCKDW